MEWRALQEDMLRQYLVTAQDDLTNKKELVNIKQARLSLAQDEFQHLNTTLSALSNSTTSCKYPDSQRMPSKIELLRPQSRAIVGKYRYN